MTPSSARSEALKATLPVAVSFLPMGAAFGLLFNTLAYPWYYAVLSGIFVFAGASQFLSVGLIAAHAGLPSIFAATLFINLRHMFYGVSLTRRYPERGWRRWYLIFTLTDETYSLLTAAKRRDRAFDESFCLWVSGVNHAAWVTGCAAGAVLGRGFHLETKGLDFVLTAVFTVLAVEQMRTVRKAFPFAVAAAAAAASLRFFPGQMLAASLTMVSVVLVCQAEFGGEARA